MLSIGKEMTLPPGLTPHIGTEEHATTRTANKFQEITREREKHLSPLGDRKGGTAVYMYAWHGGANNDNERESVQLECECMV